MKELDILTTIDGMRQRIAHHAGLPPRAADTMRAIANSRKLKGEPLTPYQAALQTIGSKLCVNSTEAQQTKNTASRRIKELINLQFQKRKRFFDIVKPKFNPDTQKSGKYEFLDYWTPGAIAALDRALKSELWQMASTGAKLEILDGAAQWALAEMIPEIPTEEAEARIKAEIERIEVKRQKKEIASAAIPISDVTAKIISKVVTDVENGAFSLAKNYRSPGEAKRCFNEILREMHKLRDALDKIKWWEAEEGTVSPSAPARNVREKSTESLSDIEKETVPNQITISDISNRNENDYTLAAKSNEINEAFETPKHLRLSHSFAWAGQYSERGWAVFPCYTVTDEGICTCPSGTDCSEPGKHPQDQGRKNPKNDKGGVHIAEKDPEVLAQLWTDSKGSAIKANPAIATGMASQIIGLDFDEEDGQRLIEEWTEKGWLKQKQFCDYLEIVTDAPVLRQKTPKGYHIPIKYFPGLKNCVKPIPGLDIRTDGGYLVAQPGRNAGGEYRWENWTAEPLIAGEEFQAYLLSIAGKEEKPLVSYQVDSSKPGDVLPDQKQFRANYPDGRRDNGLFASASAMRGAGAGLDEITRLLLKRNLECCDPPEKESKVREIAVWVCSHYATNAQKEAAI